MLYKHVRPFRYFMAFCVPFMMAFAIGFWFFDTAPLAVPVCFSLLFGLGALYALFAFILSFSWVQLDKDTVTIKLLGAPQTIAYADIVEVKKGLLFYTVGTINGRYRIDSNLHNHLTLIRDLQRRIPNIQHQKEKWITTPLPRQIPGKKSNYAFLIFLVFFFLGSAVMFLFGLVQPDKWLQTIIGILLGLFFVAFTLLTIHEILWVVPRYIRFEPDQIIIQRIIGHKIYDPADIDSVHISTILAGKQKLPGYYLHIQFKSDQKLKLEIREAWFTEHVFQIMDLMVQHYNVEPVFKKRPESISHHQFANGSKKPFSDYFQRESQVAVQSLEEVERWLRGCTYLRDHVQFGETDVWIHPVDFEQNRKGDCEDHALWAWRKLIDLNYPAEFVVGYLQNHFGDEGYHAWVTFEENGRSYLIETTAKNGQMVYPVEEQTKKYRPLFSIDQNFKTYQF